MIKYKQDVHAAQYHACMLADGCVIMYNYQSNRVGRLQVYWPCAYQLSDIGRAWLASV